MDLLASTALLMSALGHKRTSASSLPHLVAEYSHGTVITILCSPASFQGGSNYGGRGTLIFRTS